MIRNKVTDLSGNLTRNPLSDDIVLKKDEEAIKQHVDLLLLCGRYAAIGRPNVCAGLRDVLFETGSAGRIEDVKAKIRNALRYEKRAQATKIEVVFDPSQKLLHIDIEFRFVNADKTFNYKTKLRRVI
jgi:phage baseplate assembly protein W